MTKKDIVSRITKRMEGITQVQTKEIVDETFNAIIDTLVSEGRIELRNFGVFEVRRREARKARNPKTEKTVFVGPKLVVVFQPGKVMEERVREEGQTFAKKRKRKKPETASVDGADGDGRVPSTARESSDASA